MRRFICIGVPPSLQLPDVELKVQVDDRRPGGLTLPFKWNVVRSVRMGARTVVCTAGFKLMSKVGADKPNRLLPAGFCSVTIDDVRTRETWHAECNEVIQCHDSVSSLRIVPTAFGTSACYSASLAVSDGTVCCRDGVLPVQPLVAVEIRPAMPTLAVEEEEKDGQAEPTRNRGLDERSVPLEWIERIDTLCAKCAHCGRREVVQALVSTNGHMWRALDILEGKSDAAAAPGDDGGGGGSGPKPALADRRTAKARPTMGLLEPAQRAALFRCLDSTGSGRLTLAEISKYASTASPDFDHIPVIVRAFKAAGHPATVLVNELEFQSFINHFVYFNNSWHLFEEFLHRDDSRLTADQFAECACKVLGISSSEARVDFGVLGGGAAAAARTVGLSHVTVLFDAFCSYASRKALEAGLAGPQEAGRAAGAAGHFQPLTLYAKFPLDGIAAAPSGGGDSMQLCSPPCWLPAVPAGSMVAVRSCVGRVYMAELRLACDGGSSVYKLGRVLTHESTEL